MGPASVGPALGIALLLAAKSALNFSRTGPQLREEIQQHYSRYSFFALARLSAWSWALCLMMTGYGQTLLLGFMPASASSDLVAWCASFLSIGLLSLYQFCRHLLIIPASLAASSSYRLSRFYFLWSLLSPRRLAAIGWLMGGAFIAAAMAILLRDQNLGDLGPESLFLLFLANSGLLLAAATWSREPAPAAVKPGPADGRLNLVMIGCDTLRADRLGIEGYPRPLTPNLDKVAAGGSTFRSASCLAPGPPPAWPPCSPACGPSGMASGTTSRCPATPASRLAPSPTSWPTRATRPSLSATGAAETWANSTSASSAATCPTTSGTSSI